MRTLLAAGLILCSFAASAGEWTMNAAGSSLRFAVSYTGETVPGRFTRFTTILDFDPGQPGAGRLNVEVDIAGADMDSSDINEAIVGREWFDVAAFPTATFTSNTIESLADGSFVARGRLELKGLARDVAVPFTWTQTQAGATMTGNLTLDRTQFSIGTGEWSSGDLIGLDVQIAFDVQLEPAE